MNAENAHHGHSSHKCDSGGTATEEKEMSSESDNKRRGYDRSSYGEGRSDDQDEHHNTRK